MTFPFAKSALALALTLAGGAAAQAAIVDLATTAPIFTGTVSVMTGQDSQLGYDFADFWGDLDNGGGFTGYGDSTPYGSIDLYDAGFGSVVYGELDSYEWHEGRIYALFTAIDGSMVQDFAGGIVASLSDLEWSDSSGEWTGNVSFAAVVQDVAPVPLPATLPLLMGAVAFPALLRRRRKAG